MGDNFKMFNDRKFNADKLNAFIKEVESMSDAELNAHIDSIETDITFDNDDISALQKRLNDEIRSDKRHMLLYRIAVTCAAVLIPAIIVCTVAIFSAYNKIDKYDTILAQEVSIETAKGESSTTILPDGSKVMLGPASTLSYRLEDFNSDKRSVNYTGEGRFSIAKNENAPFTLSTNDFVIQVLGTVFAINSRDSKEYAEIHLEEGSIQLKSLIADSEQLMKPGETALLNKTTGAIEISDDTARRKIQSGTQTLFFSSTPLASVVEDLELYYGHDITIDRGLDKIMFTGSLPTNNLPQAIYVLERTLNISFSIAGNNMHITTAE